MQINDFKSIVTTFADPGTEFLFDKTHVVISVNGDLIEAEISTQNGDVFVTDGDLKVPASNWILNRLARLPLLANRLLSSVPQTEFFVSPSAALLRTLELNPGETLEKTEDALSTTLESLNQRSALETMVLYITSDAGEGKTSLINQLTRVQAQRYADQKTDWLLVPIPLGGRHFLRFDDITIGALQNRYRFPFLYYNSFMALVRMGVIVPAFDGFEEMFVESSSGEALSAMGILVGSLESRGAVVVAARKAYFEFENLRTQERLFDTIRSHSVGFGKLELKRWSKREFLSYCANRNVPNAIELYSRVSQRLQPNHALLTRAVLVKRLLDIAINSPSLDSLLEQLEQSGPDFFSVFVFSLIEREASVKWMDRSGENEVGSPLLSVAEHCGLLSEIALGMWESKVDFMKRDSLEFIADYFSETNKKSAHQARQIQDRIRGHAMLIQSPNNSQAVEFDHDEFRLYFLGEAIARQIHPLSERAKAECLGTFRRGILPEQARSALIRALFRDLKVDLTKVIAFILEIGTLDAQASFTRENCGEIVIRLLNGANNGPLTVSQMVFGSDSLRDRKFSDLRFENCIFSPTSVELTDLSNCTFVNCNFTQIRLFASTKLSNLNMEDCVIESMVLPNEVRETWDPLEIRTQLRSVGVKFANDNTVQTQELLVVDTTLEIRDFEKVVRYLLRSTHISESIILIKLGTRGQSFIDQTLPNLLRNKIMSEIENRGAGDQRRFRLCMPLQKVNLALAHAGGSFDRFVEYCTRGI